MIRFTQDKDKARLIGIYNECFPGEEAFCRSFFDTIWSNDTAMVLEEEGEICAMVHMLPVELQVGHIKAAATYIYAAATAEKHRGKGYMGQLLQASFAVSLERGYDFSVLITQNDGLFAFYARFGYSSDFAVSRIAASKPDGGMSARAANPADIASLNAIYQQGVAGRMHPVRSAERWREILAEFDGRAYVAIRGETITAYCMLADGGSSATEGMGSDAGMLTYALCGEDGWCLSPAGEDGRPFGCIKALTYRGEELLKGFRLPPYLNLLYN